VDPYIRVCRELEKARVRYVIVGAFGANLYARDAGCVITTQDCDLLLPPDAVALNRAIGVLRKLGFALEAGGEPVDQDPDLIRGIVRALACVRAAKNNVRIDLPLQIAGCSFTSLWARHRRVKLGRFAVRVAPLRDILRSKKLADRPKDRLFLALWEDALKQLLEPTPFGSSARKRARRRPKGRGRRPS
jgi:hypothetical protein